MKERVQKLMAQANVGSRRACEELIRQGRVRVNGQTIHLGDQADPLDDVIEVDGDRLKFEMLLKRYFAINKPMNVLSSNSSTYDDERTPVRDLIPFEGHLFSIGRLDAESDGLMVLTNDGEMTNQLTHPRYQHTKTYKVVVYGTPTQQVLDTWEQGVYLEEGLTAPCSIRVQQREADVTVMKIVMIEGKKRQIRRVAAQLGHPVKRLTRTHIGKLELGKLKPGEWYELNEEEVKLMTTPASDLSYIRKLRREQREQRKRDFIQRARDDASDNSESSTSAPRSGSRATSSRITTTRPATGRPTSRPSGSSSRGKPSSGKSASDKSSGSRNSSSGRYADDEHTSERGERPKPRLVGSIGNRSGTSGRSRSDNPERTAERSYDRTERDSDSRETTSDRPKRKPASNTRSGVPRRTTSESRERNSGRSYDRTDRDSDTKEPGSERPKRKPVSNTRSGAPRRATSENRERDTDRSSDRAERNTDSDRPKRKPASSNNRSDTPKRHSSENRDSDTKEPGSDRPKRKPPVSRSPKPRTGKPGTSNSRNKPPRKGRR
ncbi:MAG TPA: pseudouridine synthase [Phototrophicaceae bacterium]|jgi:pseudouridine synthase|nr:pseudouridine synthase [Phototrophicaceae bacterium]